MSFGFIIIGMVVNGCLYILYGKFQKHVLGVEDPPESLIMDDKVKCSSGRGRERGGGGGLKEVKIFLKMEISLLRSPGIPIF